MNKTKNVLLALSIATSAAAADTPGAAQPRMLPGELSAAQILDGVYRFPPSPKIESGEDDTGLARGRLSAVPAPGVHPRILISPADLPDLRKRLKETETGRALYQTLRRRADSALRDPGNWSSQLYSQLCDGDADAVRQLLNEHKGWPGGIGHYQPWLYAIAMESLDALIAEDAERGRAAATALTTYVAVIAPQVEAALNAPLGDDVWRARVSGPATGPANAGSEVRSAMGYQLIGYAYDFAYNFMTDAQRDSVRALIARFTSGRVWLGAQIPHHFRNWNWVAIGLQQPLLALAIEGEEGYDPRVYRLGVEIARDYLTYGISAKGVSTEAVGYTQFGLTWSNPFVVAATRRGDNLLTHTHHRAMIDWYLHTLQPNGVRWTSHGDGGDSGPAIWTLMMWRYFLPDDPKVDFLWQRYLKAAGPEALTGTFAIIEPLLWATDGRQDGAAPVDYDAGAKLKLSTTLFDETSSSLIARSSWDENATLVQFECRTDSVGASHEHADRGAFTLDAMGRTWAKDNFRSVETKFHNSVLIDGRGQGYWPGPGTWLGMRETPTGIVAACDAREAYGWFWPKQILTEDTATFERFKYPRWASYKAEALAFQRDHAGTVFARDPRPAVVRHWQGNTEGDTRIWDEDGWPVRAEWNPVQRAFRSIGFVRGSNPYLLVVDDIQKDDQEHLYEWLMQTGMNTELASRNGNDLVLCDATEPRDESGAVKPRRGARQLLVRILDLNAPAAAAAYTDTPAARLETFERKDTLVPEMAAGALSGSRSYGLDKRLVIASRSVAPNFKILLYPFRNGDPLPVTTWNADRTVLTIRQAGQQQTMTLRRNAAGRTEITVE